MEFIPSVLRIEKGSTVTWRVYSSARSHILFFDEICVESPKLEPGHRNDSFSLNFQDVGTFEYSCCIFSRMRGKVEVIDNERMMSY